MLKIILALFGYVLFFFSSNSSVLAVTFSISNPQNQNDEVTMDVSVSGISCPNSSCYLQAAFTYSTSQPRYFGFTKNQAGNWYEYIGSPDTAYIQSTFFAFQPTDGSWSGQLVLKPNYDDPDYKGAGGYTIKAWRYTGNSTSAAGSSDNTLTVSLSGPTSTPTPSPSPSPSPSPTPTPVASSTPTPSPSPTATSKPTTAASSVSIPKSATPSPASAGTSKITKTSAGTPTPESLVLGITDVSSASANTEGSTAAKDAAQEGKPFLALSGKQYLAGGLAALGALFLGASVFLFFKEKASGTIDRTDESN